MNLLLFLNTLLIGYRPIRNYRKQNREPIRILYTHELKSQPKFSKASIAQWLDPLATDQTVVGLIPGIVDSFPQNIGRLSFFANTI